MKCLKCLKEFDETVTICPNCNTLINKKSNDEEINKLYENYKSVNKQKNFSLWLSIFSLVVSIIFVFLVYIVQIIVAISSFVAISIAYFDNKDNPKDNFKQVLFICLFALFITIFALIYFLIFKDNSKNPDHGINLIRIISLRL